MAKKGNKRRKLHEAQEAARGGGAPRICSNSKALGPMVAPAGVSKVEGGRMYTVSIAVPGSVIDNTQNMEHAILVAGQLARTAAIFNIDEVVVIDDSPADFSKGSVSKAAAFLCRVLQFMETPQYLRKALIPMHEDLQLAGLLPPLDAPHHLRAGEWLPFREGVVQTASKSAGSLVDIGLPLRAWIPDCVPAGVRVTLQTGREPSAKMHASGSGGEQVIACQLSVPSKPREREGLYWGFTTRLAHGLDQVMQGCPFADRYDLCVGTSEHGTKASAAELRLPPFQHMMIVFGGPLGLEECIRLDPRLAGSQPHEIFDRYVNTCADQGSRTIRSEEAVLISLAYLQPAVHAAGANS